MKKLLIGLAILALLLVGAWYGAETWLSRFVTRTLADQPGIAAEIAPLRQPGRLGLHMQGIELADSSAGGLNADSLDAYIRLLSPTTLNVDLPRTATLNPAQGAATQVQLQDGQAEVRLSPTRGLAISHVRLTGRDLMLNEAAAFDQLDVAANLTHMGGAAPTGSAAAYRLDLAGAGLAFGALPERLDIGGAVQVWLDGIPDLPVMQGTTPPPQPTGFQTQNVTFTLGPISARLAGRIEADADGLASGQAAIYTASAPDLVEAAVTAGLMPPKIGEAVQAVLIRLAGEPPEAAEATEPMDAVEAADEQALAEEVVTLPPAGPGELRLPLFFGNGIVRLGPVPLGPAPRISGF